MSVVDPWSKAAECDRAIARVADPERRRVLERLRGVWVAVSDSDAFSQSDQRDQLFAIATIHAELMAGCRAAMH